MEGTIYLDVEEYERIRGTDQVPETYCTQIEGYWVIPIPWLVYELEFRGLLDEEESMSTYIIWGLTKLDQAGKL